MSKLPSIVRVQPHLRPLDEERDLCHGHTIKANGFIFSESGADHIYYTHDSQVRAWLEDNGYTHISDLEDTYMATPGLDGISIGGEGNE